MAEQKHRGPMGGGPRGMMPGEKAKDFKGTMGKLISYLGKYLPAIIAVMLFAIASTVFSIIGPKILGNATTELFNGIIAQLTGTGGIDFEAVARILLFLGIIYLVSAVLSYIQGFIMTKVSTQISYGMRRDISQKIMEYVEKHIEDAELSLKWIAENYLYMNVDYLSKKFLKETGCKFSKYLTDTRIKKAKEILASGNIDSIQCVADMVGCENNPQYFSQIFKKSTGMTPSKYIKMIRGE